MMIFFEKIDFINAYLGSPWYWTENQRAVKVMSQKPVTSVQNGRRHTKGLRSNTRHFTVLHP